MALLAAFLDNKRNLKLLEQLFQGRHEIRSGSGAERALEEASFDLAIADGVELRRLRDRLRQARLRVEPQLLPVLMVTPKKDVRLARGLLWKVVDDLIFTPIEKTELQARVEILLKARALSVIAHANYLSLSEAAPSGILIVRDGLVLYANEAARSMGFHADEPAAESTGGRVLDSLFEGEQLSGLLELCRSARNGKVCRERLVLRSGRGRDERLFETFAAPVNHAGQPAALLIIRDITEQRKLEHQLEQARRLETIGRLAGGVAHDFNNLLTVINGLSEEMMAELDPNDPLRKNAEEILKAGRHAALLTRQLLAYSRRQMLRPEVVDAGELVESLARMLRRLLGEDIELVLSVEENLYPVKIDPGQFSQVIMNLAANARDAMPEGGRLTISVRNVELDEDYAREHHGAKPGPHVVISVEDTGVGMAQETIDRAFDPFFTTKEVGKGTGLGLSQVQGIVLQSGGHIWLYSEPGRGTVVKIYLPACAEAKETKQQPHTAQEQLRGSGTVLVVEDEPGILRLARRALERYGYEVITAGSAEAALKALELRSQQPDLLVTDVVLPGMSGRQLAERIRKSNPDLPVVYTSGYSGDEVLRRGVQQGREMFLQKPFSVIDLASLVRKALSRSKR